MVFHIVFHIGEIKLREKISQQDFAHFCLTHTERTARLDIIINFAKALNVTTEYLLNDDEETDLKPYQEIATAIARNGNSLTAEEKNQLIALILGNGA